MIEGCVKFRQMSLEIRPLAALYPPPRKKIALKGCGGGRLMPTAFAPQSKKDRAERHRPRLWLFISFIRREGEKEVVRSDEK